MYTCTLRLLCLDWTSSMPPLMLTMLAVCSGSDLSFNCLFNLVFSSLFFFIIISFSLISALFIKISGSKFSLATPQKRHSKWYRFTYSYRCCCAASSCFNTMLGLLTSPDSTLIALVLIIVSFVVFFLSSFTFSFTRQALLRILLQRGLAATLHSKMTGMPGASLSSVMISESLTPVSFGMVRLSSFIWTVIIASMNS